MQLVGQAVGHKVFGQGVITDCSGNVVTVSFSQGTKKFIYPDAFANFLILKNKSTRNEFNAIWNRRQEAEAARKREIQEEQERRQRLRTLKITPTSQAAFNIGQEELDAILSTGFVSTGNYLSGYSKGEPRIPSKIRPNSACLFTTRPPNATEKERRILGAFMVKDSFWGDLCKDGQVEGHERFRLRLGDGEGLLYWDYLEGTDPPPRWGGTAFKYFANVIMQQILFDMRKLFRDPQDMELAEEFYQYFSEINRLPLLAE